MVKGPEEIAGIRASGKLLSKALAAVVREVKVGATTGELDALAERVIREGGGEPSFLGYKTRPKDRPFPTTMCTSINHEVVHAPATPSRELSSGDVIGFDIGARLDGWCSDMAVTVIVGAGSKEAKKLVAVTRESLMRGLAAVKPGNWVSDIGKAVQKHVEANGYSVVRDLVGHGIGREPHEDPRVPNFFDPRMRPVRIQEGMAICVEPMVNVGEYDVAQLDDGWTIVTADGSLAAHFEVTLAVTKKGYEILTPLPI